MGKKGPEAATPGPKNSPANNRNKLSDVSNIYIIFRLFARPEAKKIELVRIQCQQCRDYFDICRRCWKGQGHCAETCQKIRYDQQHREAQKQYRKTDNGKKKHREAEQQRRLGLQRPKNKKNGASKKTKQPLPAKQHNTAPATANKARKTKTSKLKKNNLPNGKTTRGYCHLCGAEGVIVKTISWHYGEAYPYFSFRIKRRKNTLKKNRGDEEGIDVGIRYYWQRE